MVPITQCVVASLDVFQIGMIGPFDGRSIVVALSATSFSVGAVLVLYSKWIEQGGEFVQSIVLSHARDVSFQCVSAFLQGSVMAQRL
jgi:hypothetical protein